MYVTIRRYTLGAGSLRDLIARIESEFVPMLRSVPGFISYSAIDAGVDAAMEEDAPVLVTISVFDSREGAHESVKRAAHWVAKELAEFKPYPPMIMGGEVVISVQE